ncbi:hypothetical protein [Agrobacterium radiobacter]|uniref:hypothetical protein n=1 Tax=Agrobacterium radiobacter TaxID=362 RepID=UPI003CE51577
MSRNRLTSTSLRWRFTFGFIVLQLCAVIASLSLVFYLLSGLKPDVAITSIWLSQEIARFSPSRAKWPSKSEADDKT